MSRDGSIRRRDCAMPAASADLRVRSQVEIRALLRQMVQNDIPVSLGGADLPTYSTSLWAEDSEHQVLVFSVDPKAEAVQRLVCAGDLTATAYLDNVKIQFDVDDLVLVNGRVGSVLNASYPREVFRFQRRSSFRVQPIGRGRAQACMAHPELAGRQLELRIIDLSYTGVALMLAEPLDLFQRGQRLPNVLLELDAGTRINTGLVISHVSRVEAIGGAYWRIGCELAGLDLVTERELQRYIDQTQRRSRLLTL
ncbi:flagellar brake protein [Sphaerotilus sulfidivorans]|uniref:Flagellar brake protein n=2 Tax=Sphaerotilus sulfidivorans TaxID=639200 RepID=A0A5C1Q2N7_9BURK|nr:flagellar brake protein [Sphaerotilus sulfidivorans]